MFFFGFFFSYGCLKYYSFSRFILRVIFSILFYFFTSSFLVFDLLFEFT